MESFRDSLIKKMSHPAPEVDTVGFTRGYIEIECDGIRLRVPNVWLDDLIYMLYTKCSTLRKLYPESFDDDLETFFSKLG